MGNSLHNSKSLQELIRISQFKPIDYEKKQLDWDVVYKAAVLQAVICIVAHEVPLSVLSTDSRWQQAIYRQQANYARYLHAEDELKKAMDAAGIPFVILKGNAVAVYY